MFTVLITPTAANDLVLALEYYNSKVPGLGLRLIDETEDMLRRIAENPEVFTIRYRDIRGALIPSFPFLIFFQIDNSSVHILRIFNTYLKPFWLPS